MQNALLSTVLFGTEQLLRFAPALFLQFQELIARTDVTVEELQAERDRVGRLSYEQLVPHTQLPPDLNPPANGD